MTGLDFLASDQRRLFIGGQWTDAEGGASFDVLDPADGSVLCQVADATVADGQRALEAAVAAQARLGRARRPASGARSCAGPSSWWPPAPTTSPG